MRVEWMLNVQNWTNRIVCTEKKKYNNKSLCAMSIVQTHNHHSLATKIAMIASRRLRTLLGCASAHTRDRCAFVHFSMAILVFLVYSGPLVIVLLTLACARAPLSLSTPHAALSCRFRTPKTGWISTLGAYFFPVFLCVLSSFFVLLLLFIRCFFLHFIDGARVTAACVAAAAV